jgi:predicted nucleotidyltransferase
MHTSAGAVSPEAQARLRAFKRDVEAALPNKVVEIRLFGSRARGDTDDDSDYDVAVFVEGPADRPEILKVLSNAAYPHVLDGFDIRPVSLPADYLKVAHGYPAELADEIARDGIIIP